MKPMVEANIAQGGRAFSLKSALTSFDCAYPESYVPVTYDWFCEEVE